MAQRLDYVKLAPAVIVDAGCGTGEAVGELGLRYPGATVLAFDIALPMVEAARSAHAPSARCCAGCCSH
jgi:malonyl-CoA O-methyltransferase